MEPHIDWSKLFNALWNFRADCPADVVFAHGHGDLRDELIEHTAALFRASGARYLLLNGENTYTGDGAPGCSEWKKQFVIRHHIPDAAIQTFLPGKNTRDEAEGLTRWVQDNSVTSIYIVSTPYHIMRAFLTDLAVARERGISYMLYPSTPHAVAWDEVVTIQSLANGVPDAPTTRAGRLVDECARIADYQERCARGEDYRVASIRDGLTYLQSLKNHD